MNNITDKAGSEVTEILFLDICVINYIKNHLEDKVLKSDQIDIINSLNEPNKRTSVLLAFLEKASDKSNTMSPEDLVKNICSDLEKIKVFLNRAPVESDLPHLKSFLNYLNNTGVGKSIEEGGDKYHSFLNKANNLKLNEIKKINRLKCVKNIIDIAGELKITKKHPIVLITIFYIYKCQSAQNILKFNKEKFKSNNAIGDIFALQRLSILKPLIQKLGYDIPMKIITGDKSLSYLLEIINITAKGVKEEANSTSDPSYSYSYELTIIPDRYHDVFWSLFKDKSIRDEHSQKELDEVLELLEWK